MTIHPSIAPLPAELAVPIIKMLDKDSKFDLDSAKRTGVTVGQIAAYAVKLVYGDDDLGGWHDRMEVGTRDRIKLAVETFFTPRESAPSDPLAESGQRNVSSFDPWSRHAALHDPAHVTRQPIPGPPVAISRYDEPELQRPSVIVTGGTSEGGDAA
jgi:hypothetical protein